MEIKINGDNTWIKRDYGHILGHSLHCNLVGNNLGFLIFCIKKFTGNSSIDWPKLIWTPIMGRAVPRRIPQPAVGG